MVLLLQGGKLYLIIVYPNSRNTEVRARCCIRGVPQLGAANRLDLEELLSFDRDTNSGSSMLGSSGECQAVGYLVAGGRGWRRCVNGQGYHKKQQKQQHAGLQHRPGFGWGWVSGAKCVTDRDRYSSSMLDSSHVYI